MPDTESLAPRSVTNTSPGQRLRKPLIEYCTNDWRNTSTHPSSQYPTDASSDEFLDKLEVCCDRTVSILKAPKLRRLLLVIVTLLVAGFFLWTRLLSSFVQEERAAWNSLMLDTSPTEDGVFGANVRPYFSDMIHIQDLDPSLVPGASKEKRKGRPGKKRLIFVGDIHGCREELEDLLKKVKFNPSTDHLISTGDIVMKGPDSLGVIDLLRGYQASCVRGNHEDRLLLVADDVKSNSPKSGKVQKAAISQEAEAFKADSPERKLAMSLNADQLAYLKSCPVILRVGELKVFGGEAIVVHAGLVPGLALEDQDPASVMNMRIVDLSTHVPSKEHHKEGSTPWYSLWNKHQQLAPAQQRIAQLRESGTWNAPVRHTTVIYGHDAKKGLQIKKYTKGLDSNCARGGQLTALVVGEKGKEEVVQVPCREHRSQHSKEEDTDIAEQKTAGLPGGD